MMDGVGYLLNMSPLTDLILFFAVLLPHIGSATFDTREAMIRLAVKNLEAGLDGTSLPAAVWTHLTSIQIILIQMTLFVT